MEFNFSKLRGRIVERFGSASAFAKVAGFTDPALSARLNNKTPWSCDEIHAVCVPEILDIPPEEIHVYFFKPLVR